MKTAVEWLVEKLIESDTKTYIHTHQLEPSNTYFNQLIEQAKQMEKEQIEKAVYDGVWIGKMVDLVAPSEIAVKYYNDNYKNTNEEDSKFNRSA